jgi:hypothetical protein
MKSSHFWDDPKAMYQSLILDEDKDIKESHNCDCFSNMMDANYEKANPVDVAKLQTHLSSSQQDDVAKLLSKCDKLFDGTLGWYTHKKLHLQFQDGSKSVHHKAFPVVHEHTEVFKKEVAHLVSIGVVLLKQIRATEWTP